MNLQGLKGDLDKCFEHAVEEMSQLRTGRATPELVENIKVEAYGMQNILKSVCSITVSDSSTIVVQPWDKTILEAVYKSIISSNLGFSASIDGDFVRVKIPDLSQERRVEFVKIMKERIEAARVAVRNVRHDAIKGLEAEKLPEDETKRLKEEIEKNVKDCNQKLEELKEKKEKELMAI